MKKYGHGLILIGLFFVVTLLVGSSLRPAQGISEAQTLDPLAYLPAILKPAAAPTATPTTTAVPPPDGLIYVDRHSVALFDQIPTQYINAAASMDMIFIDRSVGGNISDGLSCLSQPWDQAPSNCKRYEHPNPLYSVDPSEVFWTGTYDRSNWDYLYWPTNDPVPQVNCTAATGEWYGKLECYLEFAAANLNNYDVLSFQYSYLSVAADSDIADPVTGYFANTPGYDVHEQAAFEAQHANRVFIYWTTSLARTIGTQVSDDFNNQMRQYAINQEEILFDVADILSHDPDGNPCYDTNGEGHLAICPHYTTESAGGHLGSVSAGKIRVAKAFWVLMAQIAGWDPN